MKPKIIKSKFLFNLHKYLKNNRRQFIYILFLSWIATFFIHALAYQLPILLLLSVIYTFEFTLLKLGFIIFSPEFYNLPEIDEVMICTKNLKNKSDKFLKGQKFKRTQLDMPFLNDSGVYESHIFFTDLETSKHSFISLEEYLCNFMVVKEYRNDYLEKLGI